MKKLTLKEAKDLYASTGDCNHQFIDTCCPPKCGIEITNCIVCAKEIKRIHC